MARTVLIVDDHDEFRAVVRSVLELDGFEVVGEAADGASALEAVSRTRPDIVLLDVMLPDIDGFEVARRLAADADVPAIVLTSTREAAAYARRLPHSPARGFVPKRELSGAALTRILDPRPEAG